MMLFADSTSDAVIWSTCILAIVTLVVKAVQDQLNAAATQGSGETKERRRVPGHQGKREHETDHPGHRQRDGKRQVAAKTATEAKDTAREMAQNIKEKLNGGLDSAVESATRPMSDLIQSHDARITSLETQMVVLKAAVDGMSKNLDSTRHEMRGHLQVMANKLDIIGMQLLKKDG